MWTYEHTFRAQASPAEIWRLVSDVTTWPRWDAGTERMELDGPFAVGTTGRMHLVGQGALPFTLVEVEPERLFTDVTDLGDVVVRFEHHFSPLPGGTGTELRHRVVLTGNAPDEQLAAIGEAITEDVPRTMAALAELAMASGSAVV